MNTSNCIQDVRYALRQARKSPAFTSLIIFTLALGIGASVAVFSVFDAVLLRPLPYRDSSRLVAIWGSEAHHPESKIFAPYRDFEEFRSRSHSFESLAAITWARSGEILNWRGTPHQVLAIPASTEFFSLLGVPALIGRTFEAEDLQHGCSVVLAHSFWQTALGAPRNVVGAALVLNDQSCTVIGVMPNGFEFYPKQTSLWTLITPNSEFAKQPLDSVVGIFGRLRPGVTVASAERELAGLHQRVAQESPAGSWVTQITPIIRNLHEEFTWLAGRNLHRSILVLCGAVGALLLIATLNVANLLLVRCEYRQEELAVRSALGSSRSQLVRYLVIETLLLSSAGAFGGICFAYLATRYFNSLSAVEFPPGSQVVLNWHVLGFSVVVSSFTGFLCGLVPATQVIRVDINQILRQSARVTLGSRAGKAFIICQAALSMIMLVAAGLLLASIVKLNAVPLGFQPSHVLTAQISLPHNAYSGVEQRSAFYSALIERLGSIPGVEEAALCSSLGPYNSGPATDLSIKGQRPVGNLEAINSVEVSDGYFRALSMPWLRGREFDMRDRAGGQPVAIVNEQFVRTYFPNQDPIGQQIRLGVPSDSGPWLTIVGIVGSEKRTTVYHEMAYIEPALVYVPIEQSSSTSMGIVIKFAGSQLAISSALRRGVSLLGPDVPVYDIKTMSQRYAEFLLYPRLRAQLIGILAALTLLLAAVGFYGVFAHAVAQRTHEFGIRAALGAGKGDLLRMVVLQGAKLGTAGVFLGAAAALMLTRTMNSLLYGVASNDPGIFVSGALLLICIALLACYIPARRAAKVDPMVALRYE